MFDFSRVQNYYIACGYRDMRKQIDGLVAINSGAIGPFARSFKATVTDF